MENTNTTPETTTPATKPAKRPRAKGKPGSGWFTAAIIIFGVGMFLMIVGATSTNAYGNHTGPTLQAILMTFVLPLVLAAIGFCRRVLFILESRAK